MKGYAPGWHVRCTTCGLTRDAGDAGYVRKSTDTGATTAFAWCRGCRWLRTHAVERKRDTRPQPASPREPAAAHSA